jgi:hypothetical protein
MNKQEVQKMTHTIKKRTFEFKGKTFNKGLNTLTKDDALMVMYSSAKILYSRIIGNDIVQSEVGPVWATGFVINNSKSTRAMINKVGDSLYTIIYDGEVQ